jgi:Domain of unknown function (DUF4365)
MEPASGKRRTREHVIADLSICFVEWQALLCGYTVERMHHDYGIDLQLMTYNKNGEIEPGNILFQVKATDGLLLSEGQATIPVRVERLHLARWLREKSPMIVIVFDAQKRRAFWCYVQQYFQKLSDFNIFAAGDTITIRVPIVNRVNPAAMRKFARFPGPDQCSTGWDLP